MRLGTSEVNGSGTTTVDLTADARPRSRVAAVQLGVARQLSRYRGRKGVHPCVRALPHAGAGRAVPVRRRHDDEGDRAHVDVSAALVPLQDAEARRRAHRGRRGSARAAAGGLAASGAVSERGQPEQGRPLELRVQDSPPSDRPRDARDLHRIRPAAAHETAARRDRGLARARLVRELRRTDPREARSQDRQR